MNPASTPVTQRLWGARFKSEPSAALKALSRSEASFFRLVPYDLAGSRAHARELQRAHVVGVGSDHREFARPQVADHVGREAALRADRELIERQDLRGFINAALECVDRLELRHLGADEASTTTLPLGTKRSGAKPPARSLSYSMK